MSTNTLPAPEAPTLTATAEQLSDLLDEVDLDFDELTTFEQLGVKLEDASSWVTLACLVWVRARRTTHPGISWEEAKPLIRLRITT